MLLLEAAIELAKERDFELVFVGDGELRRPMERLIEQHDLGGSIRILGWQSSAEVRRALEESRVFVLPSFAEGLPVVIMEALAMGRPVISTYVAGIPELVEPGTSGWLVPAGSIDALVDAMREALDLPPARLTEMGRAGHEAVRRDHNDATEAAKLAGLLATVVGAGGEPC
jgi:glycosyltransferase involved in cell wall biosynthesis